VLAEEARGESDAAAEAGIAAWAAQGSVAFERPASPLTAP